MKKVYICIPTYNEASNIETITKIVDEGLRRIVQTYGHITPAIFNVDSASTDKTSKIFQTVQTITPKYSIELSERGKGRNLFGFIERAAQDNADCCMTIDADITSATPEWVEKMLDPILVGQAQFVAPLYERNRFEGSTTNHFAYPTVFALTGYAMRQPIGGDFAFGKQFIKGIGSLRIPDTALFYGVDIFLSLAALAHGLRIEQVVLGKKVHAPSFHKLEYMFPQVAAVAAELLRQFKNIPQYEQEKLLGVNIIETSSFSHRDSAREMFSRAYASLQEVKVHDVEWLPESVLNTILKARKRKEYLLVSQKTWIDILISWYGKVLSDRSIDTTLMAKQLLPFFVLRSVGFWFAAEAMTAKAVENEIEAQAQEFRSGLQSMLDANDLLCR